MLVRQSGPLEGHVRVPGAKNCAIKLLPASVLATGVFTLRNVPRILDVDWSIEVLEAMGASVWWSNDGALNIDSPADISTTTPYELVSKMRASVIVLGPLIARFGEATVALPGGDNFGSRPIDMHLAGLESMGAEFKIEHGVIHGRAPHGLSGAEIYLDYPSVGATEHLMMSATLADGTTTIHNAAREPEIVDEASFLITMGAEISGAGSNVITIRGTSELQPTEHIVVGDRIVAGTFICAVAAARGQVVVKGAHFSHLEMLAYRLAEMGVSVGPHLDGIVVAAEGRGKAIDFASLPFPGIATDYLPMVVAAQTVAEGTSIATENLYVARLGYLAELRRLGADIRNTDNHIVTVGKEQLSGAPVKATDIRAGAALAIAGLVADGETTISGIHHIDRGYEDLARDLSALGGDVSWS